jgi:hypothetical protein
MKTKYLTLAAGQTIHVDDIASYFHLLETSAPVNIFLLRDGGIFDEATDIEYGYFAEPEQGFTGIEIYSATAQTIKIATARGRGGYNRVVGAVSLIHTQGTFTQVQKSVTNANQVVLAANADRKYLLIQNNSATAVLRVKLDGNAATATSGLRILAGMSLELQGFVCNSAINVMMETADATANNVEVVAA